MVRAIEEDNPYDLDLDRVVRLFQPFLGRAVQEGISEDEFHLFVTNSIQGNLGSAKTATLLATALMRLMK